MLRGWHAAAGGGARGQDCGVLPRLWRLHAPEEGPRYQEGDRRPCTLGGQIRGRREPEDENEHVVRPTLCQTPC